MYVSVDMEGATGVTQQDDVTEGAAGSEQGRVLVSGDADAAVRGAFDAGAIHVLVHDAHSRTAATDPFPAQVLTSPCSSRATHSSIASSRKRR